MFLAKGMKAGRIVANSPRPMPADIVIQDIGKQRFSFQLFDPRPRLLGPRLLGPHLLRPKRARNAHHAQPRISSFGYGEVRTLSLAPAPQPEGDGLHNSACLVRRLQALHAALENLPRQARRLVRALARRALLPHRKHAGPLRPGRPPGFSKRPREEIDVILHRCDWLARDALPNTS